MKRIFSFVFAVAAMILLLSAVVSDARKTDHRIPSTEGNKANTEITAEMMNGKPAFFKTYEDFINQTGKPWTFLSDNVKYANNHIVKYELIFKDESGKKVNISSEDFWGYRDGKGFTYRNSDFTFEIVKRIPFRIVSIATDFINYQPKDIGTHSVNPDSWFSQSITSPIETQEDFYKNHSYESYKRIKRAEVQCDKDLAVKGRYTNMKDYEKYVMRHAECYLKSPDLLCIWTEESRTQTSFYSTFHGAYLFSKTLPTPSK